LNRPVDLPSCIDPTGPISGHTLVEDVWIGPDRVAGIDAAGARARSTRFVFVLAALASVLGRASGQADLSIKVSVSGRARGFGRTFGWFANDVMIRVRDASGGRDRVLPAVRETWLDSLDHQLVPYPLVQRCVEPDRLITAYRPVTIGLNARVAPARLRL